MKPTPTIVHQILLGAWIVSGLAAAAIFVWATQAPRSSSEVVGLILEGAGVYVLLAVFMTMGHAYVLISRRRRSRSL